MNAISSGVACSAAKIRSPSFSRSSSSTTITGRPAAMSSTACLDGAEPPGRAADVRCHGSIADPQQPLDVLGDHVDLQVDRVADAALRPSVVSASVVGIRLTANQSSADRHHGQRDPVDA